VVMIDFSSIIAVITNKKRIDFHLENTSDTQRSRSHFALCRKVCQSMHANLVSSCQLFIV